MPPNMAPARGITSQPSMSARLMRVDTIPAGSAIWAEDDESVWVLAEVIRQENTLLTVRDKKTGDELEIDLVRADMLRPEQRTTQTDRAGRGHWGVHKCGQMVSAKGNMFCLGRVWFLRLIWMGVFFCLRGLCATQVHGEVSVRRNTHFFFVALGVFLRALTSSLFSRAAPWERMVPFCAMVCTAIN